MQDPPAIADIGRLTNNGAGPKQLAALERLEQAKRLIEKQDAKSLNSKAILEQAISAQHSAMNTPVEVMYAAGLRQFQSAGRQCLVGSACSGTDVFMKALSYLSEFWKVSYDIDINFIHEFSVELNPDKQKFITEEMKPRYLFERVDRMKNDRNIDILSGETVLIPWVQGFFAGFPCQSRSHENKNASENKGCCRQGTGTTGSVLHGIVEYIEHHQPLFIMLENVMGLDESDEDGDKDSEFVISEMRRIGYPQSGVTKLDSYMQSYMRRHHMQPDVPRLDPHIYPQTDATRLK